MSDNIDKFIENNRDGFDDQVPPADTWNKIESLLPVKKQPRLFSRRELYKWSAAAAVLCIVLTSAYFLLTKKDIGKPPMVSQQPETIKASPGDYDLSKLAPEYADEAKQTYQSIEIRQQELKTAAKTQPALYKQFSQDLATLDSSYQVLKNQAVQTPARDLIIKAMLQNLQLQAELLNRQLMIMDQFNNNSKTQRNEKSI